MTLSEKEYQIICSTSRLAIRGRKPKTSSIQVREFAEQRYLLRKRFNFLVGDPDSKEKAAERATKFALVCLNANRDAEG